MSRFDLLRRWTRRRRPSRRSASYVGQQTRGRFLPAIESLEPRQLLAVVTMESTFNVDAGDDVTLAVTVDDATNIASVDNLTIEYDTNLLDVSSSDVVLGEVFPVGDSSLFANVNDAAGTIRITAFPLHELTGGSGNLFEITYHVRADSPDGLSDLEFTAGEFNEGGIPMTTVDGAIRVGTVVYDLNADNKINFADFSFFAAEFLRYTDGQNATAMTIQADFDGSGRVNFADFAWFAANFLKDPGDVILPTRQAPQRLSNDLPVPEGEGLGDVVDAPALVGVTQQNANIDEGQAAKDEAGWLQDVAVHGELEAWTWERGAIITALHDSPPALPIPHSVLRTPHYDDFVHLLDDRHDAIAAIDDLLQLGDRRLGEIAGELEKAVDAIFGDDELAPM